MYARLLVLSIALLGGMRPAVAQQGGADLPWAPHRVEAFQEGRADLWHLRLRAAEETFRSLAQHAETRPAAYHHLATISYLQALITEEPFYYDTFFARSDSLLDVLKTAPETPWNLYWKAETSLQRAIAWARTDRMVRAALAGRTAYGLYEDVLDADPTLYDANKGRGLFHIMIGSLPSTQRRLLRILGYGGTVEEGVAELRTSVLKGQLSREESTLYLALADLLLNNSKGGGLAHLAQLHSAHPESALFAYLYGYALLENRQARKAKTLLEFTIEQGRTGAVTYLDYADFYLAEVLFWQRRFAEAETHYRHYLKRHQGRALKALAYLNLGLSIEMQGRRDEALWAYRQVEGVRTYDSDVWANRVAQQRLEAPMDAYEKELLIGANAYEAGEYQVAERTLLAIHREETPLVYRVEAAYRLGRVLHAQGRLLEALDAYQFAISHPSPDPLARWAPWSQLYVGEIYETEGDALKARRAFEAALAYQDPYDYHQSLEQRAKTALGRLDR